MEKPIVANIMHRIANRIDGWIRLYISRREFEPYFIKLDVAGIDARFFIGTAQARDWYDPIKPHAKLEYEWVLSNLNLANQNIIDGGAHHGQYSLVLAKSVNLVCNIVSIDPYPMNCALTEINLRLNGIEPNIAECAITAQGGPVLFSNESNGRIVSSGGRTVEGRRLISIMPEADVVKLDIEGAEFDVIPDAIDEMTRAHTWIVELHPAQDRIPDEMIKLFLDKGFKVLWVNRQLMCVEPYRLGKRWDIHSTIFAMKQ